VLRYTFDSFIWKNFALGGTSGMSSQRGLVCENGPAPKTLNWCTVSPFQMLPNRRDILLAVYKLRGKDNFSLQTGHRGKSRARATSKLALGGSGACIFSRIILIEGAGKKTVIIYTVWSKWLSLPGVFFVIFTVLGAIDP